MAHLPLHCPHQRCDHFGQLEQLERSILNYKHLSSECRTEAFTAAQLTRVLWPFKEKHV